MKAQHWPDPDIRHGHLRVLPRTTGDFVVIDERRKPGKRVLRVFRTLREAAHVCELWHKQGYG